MNARKTLLGLAALVAFGMVSSCSVAQPDTSQAVLHFSGGPFSSQTFLDCIKPGTREVDGAGDYHYYYPNGMRTLDFTGGPHSDMPALQVSTRNENGTTTDMTVRGVMTFSLNTSCATWTDNKGKNWEGGALHAFHDQIGRAKNAYASDGGGAQPDEWGALVRLYLGGAAETALDTQGLGFKPQELINDAAKRVDLQDRAMTALPALIEAQTGGPFFTVHNLQIQSVVLPDMLRIAQDAVGAAQLREQAAIVDNNAAKAYGSLDDYDRHQINTAIVKALTEGRGIPVPFGTSVILPGAGGTR